MTGKVLSGCIVAFWLVMMGALVKVELWPKAPPLHEVPVAEVAQRIFANPVPAPRLNVYYRNELIGVGRIALHHLYSLETVLPTHVPSKPSAYWVQLWFHPSVASGMKVTGEAWCDDKRDVQRFNVKVVMGDADLSLHGDNRTRKINFVYNDGENHQERQFDFNDKGGGGLVGALGASSLSPASLLGGAGLPFSSAGVWGGADGPSQSQLKTAAYDTHLQVGDLIQKAYLIESRLDTGIWARTWIEESGEVLLVETSLGLTMRSERLEILDASSGHGSTRQAAVGRGAITP